MPEARAGGVDVQVLPIYVAPEVAEASLRSTLLQLEALEREAAQTPEVALCRTGADIDAALADGRIALLVALEGTPGIGADVELFAVIHRLGVRMVSFTHWSRALLAEGSADEETGSRLPAAGVRAVAELERLGILLDVSHLARGVGRPRARSRDRRRRRDAFVRPRSARPPPQPQRRASARHRGDRRRDRHERPADIRRRGGATLDRVIDHIEHIAETAGIDHVGLGPDFLREYMDAIYPQYEEFHRFGGVDLKQIVPDSRASATCRT